MDSTVLEREPSGISREITRNGGVGYYGATQADQAVWDRARRPKSCKLVAKRKLTTIVVAGVTDYGAHHFDESHRSDPHGALADAPEFAHVKLLLAHQPRSAQAAADAGFDLQLSGHTHGGQFWPWPYFVRFQQPFTAGLNKLNHLWVYTSRGTGYWGRPNVLAPPQKLPTCG